MTICGLQKLTLIDFPGRLAATVFLCGCNLRCPWCYSKELVLPEEMQKLPKISEKEFFGFLAERQGMLAGVVVCGGEPTTYQDFPKFAKKIKDMGFAVKLDTNGSNPAMLKKLIDKKLVDYVAMDVKLPKERYQKELGINPTEIEKSINILKESKIDFEFRTTIVPTVHTREDIVGIAKWLSPVKKYYLQNFRPERTINPKFEKLKPYPDKELLEIQKAVAPFFEICKVR